VKAATGRRQTAPREIGPALEGPRKLAIGGLEVIQQARANRARADDLFIIDADEKFKR
jgi:hypothetical protein